MDDDADRIIDLYRRHGLAWEADRQAAQRRRPHMEGPWLDRFVALAPPGPILDLGCGGGDPMATYLVARGRAVTGVDAAPALLDLARVRMPEQDWRLADMRGLDLGRRYAGILAWNSFFHLDFDDQRALFAVFQRHALPGAALMFTSGPRHGVAMGDYAGEPLYHASLDPAEYRVLLDAHGFDVVEYRAEDPDCGRHTVWLARGR
ncbi:class I SAM-dependent methyltransferase [Nitrospirillum viridazoti]|uniref:SAM-dependent methyltransferase n=1 Tax=Nitrospirillum viridazoti CBAmc TaxID=1441467 RepID=A0A248JYC8_9PROT|nr:class I SAM-dependent methyltransferase [Nitrospirillum amazonense]ASG23148.1 SAM-dependent methyltransferase [Nitrospirillum amazonense CBAmc]TWB38896.1 methyltransferase family protein [Nitrospirillum amazonense]